MKLRWTLNELRSKADEAFKISGEHDLEEQLKNHSNEILAASPVGVDGWMIVESEDEIHVDAKLDVDLTIPSSRSLEPVDVKLDVAFQETYISSDHMVDSDRYSSNEIIIQLEDEFLDLSKPFVDSIVLSVPSQVFTKEEREYGTMPEGNGWEVMSEEAYENNENLGASEEDSPFAALKDLFNDENQDNE